MRPPWRFNGPCGPVVLHPDMILMSVLAADVYDTQTFPPKKLGRGSMITLFYPFTGLPCVHHVLEHPEVVEEQLRERGGGWEQGMRILPPLRDSEGKPL